MYDTTRTLCRNASDAVLHELLGRGGFDHWWYEIDEETQSEIVLALTEVIYKEMQYLES